MRSMGLDPNNNFRFREYGGSRTRDLTFARRDKSEVSTLLDMSGTLRGYGVATATPQGVISNLPFIQSDYFSGSRVEVGFPTPSKANSGQFVDKKRFPPHGIYNRPSDGLWTSGSWTFEAVYKFGKIKSSGGKRHYLTQSLAGVCVTGSSASPSLLANLVAFDSGSLNESGSLRLYARPGTSSGDLDVSPVLVFSLNDVNIFDGDPWYVAFGRERNDHFDSVASSSYFIRAGKQSFGELITYKTSNAYFLEDTSKNNPGGAWTKVDSGLNASGSFLTIGRRTVSTAGNYFLNSSAKVSDNTARYTKFSGRVGQMRFWSRALTQAESEEHVKNFRSLGVRDPTVHFNFEKVASGSFGRLRMDASTDQPVTQSNAAGQIILTDFSQAGTYVTGSGFQPSAEVIRPQRFDFSMLDPKFDEGAANNKIRIRSWKSYENVQKYGGEVAPLYEVQASEKPNDDLRFGIEISAVQALDEDIVNIFSTLEALDNRSW